METANTIGCDISRTLVQEFAKQMRSINKGEILSNIIGSGGVIRPNFSKKIWIGNYYVSIKVH